MTLLNQPAPDFTLFSHKREKVTLSSFKGKKVIVAFYPAAFTGVCEKELCTFRDSIADLNAANAVVLGVSVDAPFANAAFATKTGAEFPLLSDYSRSTVKAYGVALDNFAGMEGYTASNRAVFIVDTNGTIRYEWIGANPGVEPDYAAVKAAVVTIS
jgi:glutaredoxin-dependent peroxiredoxin